MVDFYRRLSEWIEGVFGHPDDTMIQKARKRIIIIMQFLGIPVAIFFIAFFLYNNAYFFVPFLIVSMYLAWISISLLAFSKWKSLKILVWSLIPAITFLAIGIHIAQGGFYQSSGTLLYALIAPALATVGINRKTGAWVLLIFVLVVVSLQLLEGSISALGPSSSIPSNIILSLFTINLCATGTFILGSMILLVMEIELALLQTDNLLLKILPISIAKRLKQSRETIADSYDNASVIFSDIVGFTALTSGVPPEIVVKWLNDLFSEFDNLARHHGLEKIKTIGDSYMAVSGAPKERKDHAHMAISFAIDVMQLIKSYRTWNNHPFSIRIGINSGPIVAGVIGTDKFIYDIWGDTVNTASRMESYGITDKIQVSESTYQELKNLFNFESRSVLNIKGKGTLNTYILIGPMDNNH